MFLGLLLAQLDSIMSEFAAARAAGPAEATSSIDQAASPATASATSTSALVMSHTDRATTAAPPTIAEEVHDTTTASDPNPAIGTNNTTANLRTNGVEIQEENQVVATATQAVNITIGGKFTTPAPPLVASSPEVSTKLAVLPSFFSSTIKVQEILEITHHASLDCIATTPVTCSTVCLNQVTVTLSLASLVMTAPLLPATTPVLVTNLMHTASNGDSNLWALLAMEDELLTTPSPLIFSAVDSKQPFLNHDLDGSPHTRHQGAAAAAHAVAIILESSYFR